jgi:hypothetical protein
MALQCGFGHPKHVRGLVPQARQELVRFGVPEPAVGSIRVLLAEHLGNAPGSLALREVELVQPLHRTAAVGNVGSRLEDRSLDAPAGILWSLPLDPSEPFLVADPTGGHPAGRDAPVVPEQLAAHDSYTRRQVADYRGEPREGVRQQLPVAVQDHDPFTAGGFDPRPPSRIDPAISIMGNDSKPRVWIPTNRRERPVGRSIVDDDELEVGKRLCQAAVDAASDDRRAVEGRDDDAEQR